VLAPLMSSSVVTMPGDRLCTPTLLILAICAASRIQHKLSR
jgi:hypothetical protein